ncbi:hypothetical protein Hypma_002522 [Hypsizygus marmoreus]|uniref:F-box domain-containing protein n=1 Tax=Hypsizygus marmoreus TaxID=39966 RepID=A0A369J4C8_HYPMA|nr:hypothetical protein Hypma_002522 [Hypsizygus marmoreus]
MDSMFDPESHVAITVATTHNERLSDELQATARLLIANSQKLIMSVDSEIAQLQAMMDDLHGQRDRHVAHTQQYRTAIAPHRKLPVDLLEEIFISCAENPVHVPPEPTQFPWTVIQVCSKWRSVAHALPGLWSHIEAHFYDDDLFLRCLRLVERVFLSSAHLPISLNATIDYDAADDHVVEFAKLLSSYAPAFEHLEISGPFSSVKSLMSLPPGSIENLQSLGLHDVEDYSGQIYDFPVLRDAPKLRNLMISFAMPPYMTLDNLPFPQLTHLSIQQTDVDSALAFSILSLCRSLVDCVLEFQAGDIEGQSEAASPLIDHTLPALERLHLQVTGFLLDVAWFPHLELPSLVSFAFSASGNRAWLPSWTPMITRSGRLESLVLYSPINPVLLEEILATSPALMRLDLHISTLSENILMGMSTGDLVPRLTSLICAVDLVEVLPSHLEMLQTRKQGTNSVSHIAEVVFTHTHPFASDEASVRRVHQLAEEGWNISFWRL